MKKTRDLKRKSLKTHNIIIEFLDFYKVKYF
jgi:hypothetical protein